MAIVDHHCLKLESGGGSWCEGCQERGYEGGKKLDLFGIVLCQRSRGGCCCGAMRERKMMIDEKGKDCTVVARLADGRSDAAAPLCSERASDAHLTND